MSTSPARTHFTLNGKHVLAAMLAFFFIVIGVNALFIVEAVRTFPGEDAPRAYVQGLRYNEILAARRAEAARGWRARARFIDGDAEPVLRIAITDDSGAPLSGLVIDAELRRPTDARLDQPLRFNDKGEGVYEARLSTLAPGQWRVRGAAARGTDTLELDQVLTWR